MSVVEVKDLQVRLSGGGPLIVSGVSFSINEGEVLSLVGESGSGKSTVAGALLGYARRGAEICGGSVRVLDKDVLTLDDRALRDFRGSTVAYVPQDPAVALNPAIRIEAQLREVFHIHAIRDGSVIDRRIAEVMEQVNLPATADYLRRFPHQLSGGQQQRVCLAMAFLLRPRIIVLDEPTTGLDVTTQAKILATMQDLCRQNRTTALYVTHDLAVVANLADQVGVMHAGRLVELSARDKLFTAPEQDYTRRLLESVPDIHGRFRLGDASEVFTDISDPTPQAAVAEAPLLSVRGLTAHYGEHQALFDIGFDVAQGECVALVGESGSGKTTLSRAIIGLHGRSGGQVLYDGETLAPTASGRLPAQRKDLQYIFQSPYNSLNPRRTVADTINQSLRHFADIDRAEARERVAQAIDSVSLPRTALDKFPAQLSGGERQRVAIARALVCDPRVLICDEVTSALDVSVQAAIVDLLARLQQERQLAVIFVTHNLALVRSMAQRVVVLKAGRIVEEGTASTVLGHPDHPYTRQLIRDTPSLLKTVSGQARSFASEAHAP